MKTRFIFNPRSGRHKRNAGMLPQLRSFVGARSLDAEIYQTEGPGHATELAREAAVSGCLRVVAVGGDGTVNEVAQALIDTPVSMGLVPCGSGNGLALHLGLPRGIAAALDLASSPAARIAALDTGTANGLVFVNAMGLGLDADVARRFNSLVRRGLPAYARTALSAFLRRPTVHCTVTAGSQRERIDALLIAVANSDQYGNNARIAPRASVDDGLLDLVAVRPVGFVAAAILGARLFIGNLDGSSRVMRMKGARFLIERPSAGIIHTDGETHETSALVEVIVRPKSLRLAVHSHCRALSLADAHPSSGFALQLP